MFQKSASLSLEERTVGVLSRNDNLVLDGYMLVNASRETYLVDTDGRVVHEWRSQRNVFVSYLRKNGNLIRDGGEEEQQVAFRSGGAAGYVEEVTWDNVPVWKFFMNPSALFLTHHDIEPLPNGNVLLLAWQRISKDEAIEAGRNPQLIPEVHTRTHDSPCSHTHT